MKATGVVTSPNHPENYPNNLDEIETIEVESGKKVRLEFTNFEVWACDITTCPCDFVKITDGDGTTLMDNSCGYSNLDPCHSNYFLPPIITTRTNIVEIFFHTDDSGTRPGWSLNWSAVTTGEKSLMSNSISDGVILSSNHNNRCCHPFRTHHLHHHYHHNRHYQVLPTS